MRISRLIVAGLLAVSLAACASEVESQTAPEVVSEETSPTEEEPQPLGEVGNVTQLRDAVVEAGYPCPNWTQTNFVTNAAESGTCSDKDVLSTYASQADRDAQVAQERVNKDMLRAAEITTGSTIVGPNWMVALSADADIEGIHAVLGGILIS